MPLLPEAPEEIDEGAFGRNTVTAQAGVVLGHAKVAARIVAQAGREAAARKLVVEVDTGVRHAGIYSGCSGGRREPHNDAEMVAQRAAIVVKSAQADYLLRRQVRRGRDVINGRFVDAADRPAGRHTQII